MAKAKGKKKDADDRETVLLAGLQLLGKPHKGARNEKELRGIVEVRVRDPQTDIKTREDISKTLSQLPKGLDKIGTELPKLPTALDQIAKAIKSKKSARKKAASESDEA